jgi:hypothetical protein
MGNLCGGRSHTVLDIYILEGLRSNVELSLNPTYGSHPWNSGLQDQSGLLRVDGIRNVSVNLFVKVVRDTYLLLDHPVTTTAQKKGLTKDTLSARNLATQTYQGSDLSLFTGRVSGPALLPDKAS